MLSWLIAYHVRFRTIIVSRFVLACRWKTIAKSELYQLPDPTYNPPSSEERTFGKFCWMLSATSRAWRFQTSGSIWTGWRPSKSGYGLAKYRNLRDIFEINLVKGGKFRNRSETICLCHFKSTNFVDSQNSDNSPFSLRNVFVLVVNVKLRCQMYIQ